MLGSSVMRISQYPINNQTQTHKLDGTELDVVCSAAHSTSASEGVLGQELLCDSHRECYRSIGLQRFDVALRLLVEPCSLVRGKPRQKLETCKY